MSDRETLLALAERCEAMDADSGWAEIKALNDAIHGTIVGLKTVLAPDYCRSLDAAMTLMPTSALWEVDHKVNIGTGETFLPGDGEPRTDFRAGVGMGDVPARWTHSRSFASPALALAAAALRARAAQ
jgi:hypothetical protein